MLNHMLVAVNAVLPCFLIVALGLTAKRCGMLEEKSLGQFNSVAFRIFLPCQIFRNVYDSHFDDTFSLKPALFILVSLFFIGALSLLVAVLAEPRRNRRGVIAQGMYRSNYVLLGIPLMQSLFGADSIGLASLMIAINIPMYNILSVFFLELYAGGEMNFRKLLKDIATNPLIDATFLALAAKALHFPLSAFPAISSTLTMMGAAATPLCLFILGASFVPASIRNYKKSLWITILFKLLIMPGLTVCLALFFGIRGPELFVILMSFGTPAAVNSYTMTREIGGDSDLAASIVVISTALSCLTLFVWIVFLKTMGWM